MYKEGREETQEIGMRKTSEDMSKDKWQAKVGGKSNEKWKVQMKENVEVVSGAGRQWLISIGQEQYLGVKLYNFASIFLSCSA